MRKGWLFTLAALAALAAPAEAQQAEPQALRITATNTTATVDGRAADDGRALPGDVLEYTLVFTNLQPEVMENVVLTDPIPAGLEFVLGSADADREGAQIEFSIDGGATWSAAPTIRVDEAGEVTERPAPAGAYTHVRWTIDDSVAPGATVTARFRATAAGSNGGGR